jgi:hypothetical protein
MVLVLDNRKEQRIVILERRTAGEVRSLSDA